MAVPVGQGLQAKHESTSVVVPFRHFIHSVLPSVSPVHCPRGHNSQRGIAAFRKYSLGHGREFRTPAGSIGRTQCESFFGKSRSRIVVSPRKGLTVPIGHVSHTCSAVVVLRVPYVPGQQLTHTESFKPCPSAQVALNTVENRVNNKPMLKRVVGNIVNGMSG